VNLLNWFFGPAQSVGGTVINSIFSKDTDDEVYSTVKFASGPSAQLSVNWSDESYRKMTVKVSVWGSGGRIQADRQECQVFLRNNSQLPPGYGNGWNVRNTTELTQPVWFYLRGEEYSAQLDYFIKCVLTNQQATINSFAASAQTDQALLMMREDANAIPANAVLVQPRKKSLFWQ
jgi:predicted dehydrogenase